jgi:hypothetical protein
MHASAHVVCARVCGYELTEKAEYLTEARRWAAGAAAAIRPLLILGGFLGNDRVVGSFHVELRLSDVGLDWCEGRMPTVHGDILVHWWKEDDKIMYQTEVPAGYTLTVKGAPGLQLAPKS